MPWNLHKVLMQKVVYLEANCKDN